MTWRARYARPYAPVVGRQAPARGSAVRHGGGRRVGDAAAGLLARRARRYVTRRLHTARRTHTSDMVLLPPASPASRALALTMNARCFQSVRLHCFAPSSPTALLPVRATTLLPVRPRRRTVTPSGSQDRGGWRARVRAPVRPTGTAADSHCDARARPPPDLRIRGWMIRTNATLGGLWPASAKQRARGLSLSPPPDLRHAALSSARSSPPRGSRGFVLVPDPFRGRAAVEGQLKVLRRVPSVCAPHCLRRCHRHRHRHRHRHCVRRPFGRRRCPCRCRRPCLDVSVAKVDAQGASSLASQLDVGVVPHHAAAAAAADGDTAAAAATTLVETAVAAAAAGAGAGTAADVAAAPAARCAPRPRCSTAAAWTAAAAAATAAAAAAAAASVQQREPCHLAHVAHIARLL